MAWDASRGEVRAVRKVRNGFSLVLWSFRCFFIVAVVWFRLVVFFKF